MDIKQIVDSLFSHEMAIAGQLSEEAVKKIIEKIVDEYVTSKPASQEERNIYIINAATLVELVCRKASDLGMDMTLLEVCQEIIKAFAKHSLDDK